MVKKNWLKIKLLRGMSASVFVPLFVLIIQIEKMTGICQLIPIREKRKQTVIKNSKNREDSNNNCRIL